LNPPIELVNKEQIENKDAGLVVGNNTLVPFAGSTVNQLQAESQFERKPFPVGFSLKSAKYLQILLRDPSAQERKL
jgi:hypothetical protein